MKYTREVRHFEIVSAKMEFEGYCLLYDHIQISISAAFSSKNITIAGYYKIIKKQL